MATIRASIIDGVATTPRYRERSLTSLHKALEDARSEIKDTILSESKTTSAEASTQYLLTLNAIKIFHASVNPQVSLEAEYRIAKSRDHADRRRAYGYAYIVPASNHLLYSTVVPVAAAVAAGNCVLIEQTQSPNGLAAVLRRVLTKALQPDVFAVVTEDPFDESFARSFRVLATGRHEEGKPAPSSTLSHPTISRQSGLVAAIIDRGSDLRAAARDCVNARFGFGGTSSYAPDIVLVNEFSVEAFSSEVMTASLSYLTAHANGSATKVSPNINKREAQKHETVLASGDRGSIILLPAPTSGDDGQTDPISKVTTPTLILQAITSSDDAIDLLNAHQSQSQSPSQSRLLANYIYAEPASAKYLSQFIASDLSTINHIPAELLIGPPAPSGYATSIHPRYTPEMFSSASPAFIEGHARAHDLAAAVWPSAATSTKSNTQKTLESLIDATLVPVKEPFGPAVGFFEQGLLFGVSMVLSSLIVGGFVSVHYGYPALMGRLRG